GRTTARYRQMRLSLLAFALGVLLLQWQRELPSGAEAMVIVVPLLVAAVFTWMPRGVPAPRRQLIGSLVLVATAFAAGLAGFHYAALAAKLRLMDALPYAWEGLDIDIVGVIDEMPQPGDGGARFAFRVERVLTADAVVPSRVSLSWHRG